MRARRGGRALLTISPATIYGWIMRGVVDSRRIGEGGRRRQVVMGLEEEPDLVSIHRRIWNQETCNDQAKTFAED